MRFCGFSCKYRKEDESLVSACLAENGIYCSILDRFVPKSAPCTVSDEQIEEYNKRFDRNGT